MSTTTTLPPPQPPTPPQDQITIDDLPYLDINLFTQSELLSLCRTSRSYFDPYHDDNLGNPTINKAVFNESAGSRRQTYSRVRLRNPHHRTPRVLHRTSKPELSPSIDPENHAIVHYLKHFLAHGLESPPPLPPPLPKRIELGVEGGKRKMRENGVGVELKKVNKKGELVDFDVLGSDGDGLYEGVLKKRSEGLVSEEEVLGFIGGLEGQWCSRRKRRKYVDAGEFGDALPIGWRILLGIRRRDGTVTVYCRRFISPSGQQFLSCKEAALFLKSHFALNNPIQPIDERGFSMPHDYDLTSIRNVGGSSLDADLPYEKIPVSFVPVSDLHGAGLSLVEMDNLAEPTKRVKFGRPIGEGVIIRDGKFECQFCHKVFEERRKYNGHVGVHVRNRETGGLDVEVAAIKSNGSFTQEELVLHTTTVNISLELDDKPTLETRDGTASNSCPSTMTTAQDLALVTRQQLDLVSDKCESIQPAEDLEVEALNLDVNQHDVEGSRAKGEMMNIDIEKGKPNNNFAVPALNDLECLSNDLEGLSREQTVGFALYEAKSNNTSDLIARADVPHNDVASSSEFFMQSLECLPEFESGAIKGETEFFNVDTKLENVTGFEELGLDDLEPFDNTPEMVDEPSPVRFGSEEMRLNMDGGDRLTTLCVWCRSEFRLEHIDSEAQSDTIGYMCPTCKDKISGLS